MLEGLVASLLNRFLGMYIRNFDPKQLNVGIWSGDVKLRDLELRKEALDQLKLPINVVEGHLGALTLTIPWSNLRGQPVKVFIEDVFLLAAPREDAEYDQEEEERRQQTVKIEKLDSAEMLKDQSKDGMSQEEQQKSQSFTESLVTKIVDNLQITVKNIHIRYEDSISAPGHPFAIGLTLQEFSAISTDGDWKPTYIQNSVGGTHKLAKLEALAAYWNTDSSLLGTGREAKVDNVEVASHDEMMRMFKEMITKGDNLESTKHQFVLKPVSGQAKLVLNQTAKTETPRLKAGLIFDEIGLVLDDDQYRDALMMVDLFHYFMRHQEYKKLQPKGATPKEDPRAWLKFAVDAVLSKIHDRNRRWSWDFFKERRDDRIRYIELFKKKKQDQPFSAQETEDFNKLEWKLNYEDMRFWRSLARSQLKKENAAKPKPPPQQKQGWVAWAWGSKPTTENENENEETQMTEEDRKKLYDAIDWDEKTAIAESVDLPRETVKLEVEASLNTGSFTLKRDPHKNVVEVLSLYFDDFKASFLQRPDSFLADASLGGLRVNDGTTENSLFPQIVRVKDAPNTPPTKQIQELEDEDEAEKEGDKVPAADPFFRLQFEKNPLDESADLAVTAKLKSMEVIYNPNFVVEIVRFFKPPERHMESIGALMESAGASVEAIRQQTRAGLEFALEEHKTINAKLDLQAPLIIIPESIAVKDTMCLIVDAGHMSINSELVDKTTLNELQSKQKQTYTEEDYKRLEGLMYDKFLLKLESTQVLIGPSVDATKAQLQERDDSKSMHILDRVDMSWTIETSIMPKAPNLTKMKISGRLPFLKVAASDQKYKALMRLIDVAIPRFDDDDDDDVPQQKSVSGGTKVAQRPRAKSSSSHIKQRPASTNFQFSALQDAIILEGESSEDEEESFQDARDGTDVSADLKAQQKNFALNFTVDRLQGSLYRSDPEGKQPDKLLLELVVDHFHIDLAVRPYDIIVEVFLTSLNVEDHIDENPVPEFRNIVSSRGAGPEEGGSKHLVHVKVFLVKPKSPEFMKKYEGIGINVDVDLATISLVVTRKSLLTLLDFILDTFANQDAASSPTKSVEPSSNESEPDDDTEEVVNPTSSTQDEKIRVKVKLQSIELILNADGIRLATLTLSTADVGVFLMGKTMRVGARLGDLSLLDDINQGAKEESPLRQLLSIQGDELADFAYSTYDVEDQLTYPGYDAKIFLRAGSLKLNFSEEPFRKIINFLVKFGAMKNIFDAARQAAANQAANQIQNAAKMAFDIKVNTPIIIFPRVMNVQNPKRDLLTAYLGEIYAENKFVPLDDSETAITAMKISAGIRNIRLTSDFYFGNDVSEELELISKVDFTSQVTYAEHQEGMHRPDLEVVCDMTDFNFRITQTQMRFLLELSRSIPAAFSGDLDMDEQEVVEDLPQKKVERIRAITPKDEKEDDNRDALVDLRPELSPDAKSAWAKLDLKFHVKTIGLELILAKDDEPVGDLEASSLSKFSLDDTHVKLRMISDGSLESEFTIQSFSVTDSRRHETNKFRKVMTSNNKDVQQFMASVTISGGKERNLIAMVAVDSPRIIFALDYLFSLQAFVAGGLAVDEFDETHELEEEDISTEEDVSETTSTRTSGGAKSALSKTNTPESIKDPASDSSMSIAFRVNIVEAQIILIANPLSTTSEAIVLGTKQILLAQQHALTFSLSNMGMFLCRMDRLGSGLGTRILDDFSLQLSMDSSQPQVNSIHIDVEPLVLRLSLRDILLALQIVQKASELSNNEDDKKEVLDASEIQARKYKSSGNLKQRTASGKGGSTVAKRTNKSIAPIQVERKVAGREVQPPKHEELTAIFDGIRAILIGDLHELPILDVSVKNFTAHAHDWSSRLSADVEIDMFANIYNFSKSAWEPLVEPWQLGAGVSKPDGNQVFVEMTSKKTMDVTITSASIALASKSVDFFTQDEDVLSKPRGIDAPYRVRNHTGFDLNIWADSPGDPDDQMAAKLADGEEIPWRFEDWEKMRENLSPENNTGVVGVKLQGSGFDGITKIPVNREGETIYSLRPRKDQILHRLLVDVKLGADNVKSITFRSPLLVENNTQIPVELGVFDVQEGHLLKIEKIAPGESRPAPVGAAFMKSLLVRPDQGFGYGWSEETLWWKDLLKRPTMTITCKGETDARTPPFYFQMNANYDKSSPLTKIYPYMRIRLSAPVELENLLPYDFKYRIYDKNTKKDWTNFLRKGGLSPVHVVELSHLLLLGIDMQDTSFQASEFAIINSNNQEDFRKEHKLICKDEKGLALHLRLHYFKIPDSGGAFRVTVYSPYVVLNKTGLEIEIKAKSLLQQAKTAAGQGLHTNSADGDGRKALPYMFAFDDNNQRNRVILKVGESTWSKPQSFDAIGSTTDVILPNSRQNTEIHVGITVESGEGKYKLTKVVTLAPRFVLKNRMNESLDVREPGSSEIFSLKAGALQPLHFMQKTAVKQLCLCFPGLNNQWSAPFTIQDLGTTHIKLAKAGAGQPQQLIRCEILIEHATIFLHLGLEKNNWPFSMRNESDTEFMFYQANPNLDEDETDDQSGWRPIRYRLPARSIMPYAWDYPAAKNKEVVINAFGKKRHVKLAEIGNLIPFKIGQQKVIDLNVAADGPTQTLVLSNYRQSKSLYKQKSNMSSSAASVAGGFEVKNQNTDVTFKTQLKLAGIGVSLINAQLKELAYVTLRDINVQYSESALYQTISSSIKWIQIDNQLYGGIFPMILYPSVVQKNTKETEDHPSVHFMISRVKDDSYGVTYIKYATVLLQQMTLEIDEDFVYALLEFSKVPGASWSEQQEGTLCDESLDIPEPMQQDAGQDIYFELLNLQPMQLDLSFVRTERINVEDKTSSRNPLMFFLNVLTMAIGNINDAPVRMNALMLENARVSTAVLVQNISNHYSQEALYQVHKILGSADFLGNPVGLFSNLSSGVADIFYEPYQGFITDKPEQLGIGIAKGATSFVKKSVFGFSDSFSKVTGSIGKGLAAATMDKQFQDRRRMTRSRNRPKHALYGVTSGANSFVSSVASGVGGLARQPLMGAEQEGVGGFFKGIGKGVVGLATKPVVGIFDLASNVSEGIRNTTTVFDADGLDRVRLTRFVGADGIVHPYNQREALGQFWLKQLDNGKYFDEMYLAHLELPREDVVVLLTYTRIMLVKAKRLTSEWDVPLRDIATISKERTGLSLTLRGGTNGPFIPVGDEGSRNWLYSKIGIAVGEFNKRFRATE